MRNKTYIFSTICALIFFLTTTTVTAMENYGYRTPDKRFVKLVDAPNPPQLSISPAGGKALLIEYSTQLSLENLAEPHVKVAGLNILTRYNIKKRSYYVQKISLMDLTTKETKEIQLPAEPSFGFPIWSPDGEKFAAVFYKSSGSSVWVFDLKTLKGKQISPARVNSVLIGPFWWSSDNKHVFVPLWNEKRGAPPKAPVIPETPEISESTGKVSQVRTYQDLIKTAHDEKIFEYYATSQLYKINVSNGKKTKFGTPGLLHYVGTSPDGKYSVARIIETPFSHNVPARLFPKRYELWDSKGKLIKVLAHLPAGEEIPIEGVAKGMRNLFWQDKRPATLCWVEALDEGDPKVKVDFRDVMYAHDAPFDKEPREIIKLPKRYSGLDLLDKQDLAFIWDYDRDTRWIQARVIDMSVTNVASECKLLFGRNYSDNYNNQGELLYATKANDERVAVLERGKWVYLVGAGATPDGYRPFVRRFNYETEETQDVFVASLEKFESFVGFADKARKRLITRQEDQETPPNYFERQIKGYKAQEAQPVTFFESPNKELAEVKKELIKYERSDGLPLSGVLYYPFNYKPGKRYPTIIWAYPREYTSKEIAGQVRTTTNKYARISGSSILFFLLRGYAVLNSAEIPVVGDPLTANDNFIQQITWGAEAAVNKLVELGIAERGKIGIAGHSYGGFMVANLLAHTDLFAAGIARSGAYNRTLTPFGFQGERRTYWEAQEIYQTMSPFSFANKIKTPILMIHGKEDPNPGTFPMQSERLFAAIKGHGGIARLVVLPHEGHSYEARESILHVLTEQFDWFDKYLKGKAEK
jgi:dipeptidyl aminopeptidase/acylaminoacyl peptidase